MSDENDRVLQELRDAGFEQLAESVRAILDQSEDYAAEINRRRGEMSVARAQLTDDGIPSVVDGITLTMSQRISLLALDAARYKKLRANGNDARFGPLVVIRTEDALPGTQTISGNRLDEILDLYRPD